MTSYADKNSEWVYDWPEIINRGESGDYTPNKAEEWVYAAAQWVSCACGNLCEDIDRKASGRPIDTELALAGEIFARKIQLLFRLAKPGTRKSAATAARITLSKIEERSAFLLSRKKK